MIRRFAAAGVLLALLPAAGCTTWQDRAHAKALATCQDKVDAEERRLCHETVMAAEKAKYDKEAEVWEEKVRAAEDRELNRKVYGGPGQVDK